MAVSWRVCAYYVVRFIWERVYFDFLQHEIYFLLVLFLFYFTYLSLILSNACCRLLPLAEARVKQQQQQQKTTFTGEKKIGKKKKDRGGKEIEGT